MLPSLRSPRPSSRHADQDLRRPLSRPADLPAPSDANRVRTVAPSAPAARDDSHAHAPAAKTSTSSLKQNRAHPSQTETQQLTANGLSEHQQDSSSTSQDTSTTDQADRVFTPPVSDDSLSAGNGNDHDSSQDSQLLKLSQLAAAQEKMPDLGGSVAAGSRKRMADGMVKHTRAPSSASPAFAGGHSRNTSTVSVASTAGSRIGELSAELKSKLSYAMLKVNHGWQYHSIDQVESLASQAASPTSTNSTIPGRHRSSASPRLALASPRSSNESTPPSTTNHHFQGHIDHSWRDGAHRASGTAVTVSSGAAPSLAPPASIQPSRHPLTSRRNSNPRYTPAFLSQGHNASPHTPGQAHSAQSTPNQRHLPSPMMDPIVFSPHQNVREQDAIESLLFMSSPGNSANMKHTFPTSSSQPLMPTQQRNGASVTSSPHRTALPGSAPRKSLPTGRPSHQHSASQPVTLKRVGFEKGPRDGDEMDVDETYNTPRQRGPNGGRVSFGESTPRPKVSLSTPLGLSGSSRPRPPVADEDIERMLDRVAAAADDSSDSESEIEIPVRRPPPGHAEAVGR